MLVETILFVSFQSQLNLKTSILFLTTRVKKPNLDGYKKLARSIQYIRSTGKIILVLEANKASRIRWWIDAAYGVQPEMKIHYGITMPTWEGSMQSKPSKQKPNMRISTEAKIVRVDVHISCILWSMRFLEDQGYRVEYNIL